MAVLIKSWVWIYWLTLSSSPVFATTYLSKKQALKLAFGSDASYEKVLQVIPQDLKKTAQKTGFRGASMFLSAVEIDGDSGAVVGQLEGADLLTEGESWQADLYASGTRTVSRRWSKRANEGVDSFAFGKYQEKFGFSRDRPLIYSHVDPTINNYLAQHLGGTRVPVY